MDMDLLMIVTMIIIVTGIIGGSVNGVVQKVLEHRRELAGMEGNRTSSLPSTGLADRTDMIEDRLRVLERLATDRGQLLSDEIDALRESQPALSASDDEGKA